MLQQSKIAVRVFTNGPGDRNSIPGRVIPKTKKWYLMPSCLTLSNIRYGSRVKWSNRGKGVAPFPTAWCSSYWKGGFWVTLDYGLWTKHIFMQFYFCLQNFNTVEFIFLSVSFQSRWCDYTIVLTRIKLSKKSYFIKEIRLITCD